MSQSSLFIVHGNQKQYPAILDDVQWELSRQGEPGKLTFSLAYDNKVQIEEGDVIGFQWNGANVFYGYLFSHSMTKDGEVECIAYDQLRYLQNSDTIAFEKVDAPELFNIIKDSYGLTLGTIEKTGYRFSMVEDSATIFDMIGDFTDNVLINKQRMYVMYDDFGEICYRDLESAMGVGYLLTDKVAGDYDYEVSIDEQTYNRIVLTSEDGSADQATDKESIYKYGLLQYTVSVDNVYNGLAKQVLELYNRPSKTLKITDAVGDVRVRAGSWIPVNLDLGFEVVSCPLIVEQITHKFKHGDYTMDMTLIGGKGFVA